MLNSVENKSRGTSTTRSLRENSEFSKNNDIWYVIPPPFGRSDTGFRNRNLVVDGALLTMSGHYIGGEVHAF